VTSRSTLATKAYRELRGAIASGRLRSGAALLEADIARMLNVSRTPVREALLRLELEGYAQRDESDRLLVRESTRCDISNWFVIRDLMESYAVRLAAERISDEELEELDDLIAEDAEALKEGRVDRLATLNEQVHNLLYRASRNRALLDLVRRLRGRVYGMSAFAVGGAGEQEAFVREHAELARLLREGAGERAAEIVGDHLQRARDLLAQAPRPDDDREPGSLQASGETLDESR